MTTERSVQLTESQPFTYRLIADVIDTHQVNTSSHQEENITTSKQYSFESMSLQVIPPFRAKALGMDVTDAEKARSTNEYTNSPSFQTLDSSTREGIGFLCKYPSNWAIE